MMAKMASSGTRKRKTKTKTTIRVTVCRTGEPTASRSGLPIGTKVGDLFGHGSPPFGKLEPCSCNKVVRWKSETSAMFTNVASLLREYLGGATHSMEYDHGLNRWLCVLVGKSVRFADKPRSFEVFWEIDGIRTSPHSQDDFTKAVADGFAALCEKKWNREPPEDREAD